MVCWNDASAARGRAGINDGHIRTTKFKNYIQEESGFKTKQEKF